MSDDYTQLDFNPQLTDEREGRDAEIAAWLAESVALSLEQMAEASRERAGVEVIVSSALV